MRENRQIVFLFGEGKQKNFSTSVLGGKGAGLAEMAALGLPIPPGFTITTNVSRAYLEENALPKRLAGQVFRAMDSLERQTGKTFGSSSNPLLISVRSGAPVSMPGMLDTILNLGLNQETVLGFSKQVGQRCAYDSYRRFIASFGTIVLGLSPNVFDIYFEQMKRLTGVQKDSDLSADDLYALCEIFRAIVEVNTGRPFPDSPLTQLEMAIYAVFRSWNNERAVTYRQNNDVADWMGTAVNVQSMVFGNAGNDSATGVVFSRNVTTGANELYGEFLVNAQGEDVVSGSRTPQSVTEMRSWNSDVFQELSAFAKQLEEHYKDVVDIEFTVEHGHLYLLQVRKAKCTAQAAATIAVQNFQDGRWTKDEAIASVGDQVTQLLAPTFDETSLVSAQKKRLLSCGLAVAPGAAVGLVTFSAKEAIKKAATGKPVILIRPDTNPNDLGGILVSSAVVTTTGGGLQAMQPWSLGVSAYQR